MDRKYDVITLGEILLRLSTPINGRLAQGDTLMKHLGGAELNIASEIGQLGLKTAMISKIPNNLLAAFIKNQMNASRVSENYLISDTADDSRIGVYYYEYGSYPRKPRVVYDRKHSSINNIDIKDVPETMFYNTRLFHTSGITLGLGGNAQKFAIECIRKFKEQGTLISFDVNYRANLWTGEEARAHVQRMRNKYTGIMVGVQTVLADDPMLTCRIENGIDRDTDNVRNPIRIICDSKLRIPEDSNIVQTAVEIETIVATTPDGAADTAKCDRLREKSVSIIETDSTDGNVDLGQLMDILGGKGIDGILLEGGGELNYSMVSEGLVDEACVFIAPKIFGGEGKYSPVSGTGVDVPADAHMFRLEEVRRFDEDVMLRYKKV